MVRLRHGRPVEIPPLHRLLDIAVELSAVSHEKPVLRPMGRRSVYQPPLLAFLCQFTQNISLRPHLPGIPAGNLTAVHHKSIVVLRHRHYVGCPRLRKQIRPGGRIKLFRRKQRNKVLISKRFVFSIDRRMMLIYLRPLDIHIAGIPFISKCWDTVDSPVNKNTKFTVPVPLRRLIGRQRFPRIRVGPLFNHPVDFLQIRL